MAQETYLTGARLRAACERSIAARDAWHSTFQPVIQGAFVLAKAHDDRAAALAAFGHLRRYLQLLFGRVAL